jgi:hypothetical protein
VRSISWLCAIICAIGYEHLFGERDLALLYGWLQETGELFIDLDRPHSRGDNSSAYFIRSLPQLRRIVAEEKHPEVHITIFREKQYPIQGSADETLMTAALDFIPDGKWFNSASPGDHPPAACSIVGFGNTHAEVREGIIRLRNQSIYFGRNPFDQRNSYFEKPDDAWVVNSYRHPQKVSKNSLYYAPFETEPDRYRSRTSSW